MKPSELLAQVNDCFRDCPPVQEIMSGTTAALAWKGRTAAVMGEHSFVAKSTFDTEVRRIVSNQTRPEVWQAGYRTIMELLYEVQHDLRMKSGAVGSTAIARGGAFDYFKRTRHPIARFQLPSELRRTFVCVSSTVDVLDTPSTRVLTLSLLSVTCRTCSSDLVD